MFRVTPLRREGYVELVCKGPANLSAFKDLVERISKGEFGGKDVSAYLIDLRPIAGTIDTPDRYELGAFIGRTVPHLKIAAISKKKTHSKLGEDVAVNRGANILATDDENEARAWLLGAK